MHLSCRRPFLGMANLQFPGGEAMVYSDAVMNAEGKEDCRCCQWSPLCGCEFADVLLLVLSQVHPAEHIKPEHCLYILPFRCISPAHLDLAYGLHPHTLPLGRWDFVGFRGMLMFHSVFGDRRPSHTFSPHQLLALYVWSIFDGIFLLRMEFHPRRPPKSTSPQSWHLLSVS